MSTKEWNGEIPPGIIKLLNNAVVRSRGDASYKVDENIHPLSALSVATRRAAAAARGLAWERLLRSCGRPLFVGRRVRIQHPRLVSLGNGCSIGDYAFVDALSGQGVVLGNNVTLERYVTIRATGTLARLGVGCRIGNNSSLGMFSYVGAFGGVSIGDDVLIGQFVSLHAANHIFDETDKIIRKQGVTGRGIRIGNNCWIGAGTTILDGVTIGDGCVVGASSVVTSDLEPDSVAFGTPARVVRKRGEAGEEISAPG